MSAIFEYLSNMQQFVKAHPIISKIEPLQNEKHLILETIKLGPSPISFTYTVPLQMDNENSSILIKTAITKLTKVKMTFKQHQSHESTIIHDEINFNSILPLIDILQK